MEKNEEGLIHKMIFYCKRLGEKNFIASADGNVSARLDNETILITPSGVNKAFLEPSDFCKITLDNKVLSGKPSSERLMHLEVYRRSPVAQAVFHAHPPTAVAWTIAHPELKELPAECLSETLLATDGIPIVPYARPSTSAMGENLIPFLPQSRVMILARHGALSWGESIDEAYNGLERLEHSAMILWKARMLGPLQPLPESEIRALQEMRRKLGPKTL